MGIIVKKGGVVNIENYVEKGATVSNTYNGTVYQGSYEVKGEENTLSSSLVKVKGAIEHLFEEGVMTEARQWYAIYRVLTTEAGFPKKPSDFMKSLETLRLGSMVDIACEYNNWRRVGNDTRLGISIHLWRSLAPLTESEVKQVTVMERLQELLNDGA